jgi:hypothetical protein
MKPAEFGFGLKCNELFALASRLLAFEPTPLLLRFFSTVPPLSPEARPTGLPLPLRFSPLAFSSAVFDVLGGSLVFGDDSVGLASGATDSELSFGGDPELPNILFSRPPWEEKLLRLLPATLLTSFVCLVRRLA